MKAEGRQTCEIRVRCKYHGTLKQQEQGSLFSRSPISAIARTTSFNLHVVLREVFGRQSQVLTSDICLHARCGDVHQVRFLMSRDTASCQAKYLYCITTHSAASAAMQYCDSKCDGTWSSTSLDHRRLRHFLSMSDNRTDGQEYTEYQVRLGKHIPDLESSWNLTFASAVRHFHSRGRLWTVSCSLLSRQL